MSGQGANDSGRGKFHGFGLFGPNATECGTGASERMNGFVNSAAPGSACI